MSINILPNELLEKIFIYFIPGIDCDLCEFRKYFFLDMRWTSILLSFSFRCKYAKKLGIYKFYKKKYDFNVKQGKQMADTELYFTRIATARKNYLPQ